MMNALQLQAHLTALRQALINQDKQAVREHQDWLTGAVAAALLNQEQNGIQALRAGLVDLAPLADKYASDAPGERWRALGEVLQACADTWKPLEQVRLVEPNRLSGQIIRQIRTHPGITPSVIAANLDKTRSHISNELKALYKEGLIDQIPRGRDTRLYLSGVAKELLDTISAVRPVPEAKGASQRKREYPHADPERISNASTQVPGPRFSRRVA